jgi:hypothetical protein
MRATEDRQVIALFGGEQVANGYRGRRSAAQFSKRRTRRAALFFGALLIGFATAATAITVKRHGAGADGFSQGASANFLTLPGRVGFEDAVY